MSEQEKQTGQPILSDEEKKFNRQVNYFIMRYMWQVLCERNPEDTIYKAFHTSRERYTRIIKEALIKASKSQANRRR